MEDYYSLLGVSKTATDKEIKSAYRKKALEWHPDRNKTSEAEAMFKKINKAYETLSNAEKRRMYDQLGHAAYEQYGGRASGGPAGGASGGQPGGGAYGQYGPFTYTYTSSGGASDFGGFNDPFDIFEQFFGGASPFGGARRQAKPVYTIRLSFNEAVHGVEKEAVIAGQSRKMKFPAGVNTGNRIRFDDFDVRVEVSPHPSFKREDQNIIVEKEISFVDAVLGGAVEVETIEKPVKVKVRPGTESGTVMRLREKGVPFPNSRQRGDQYVVFKVKVPDHVSGKTRKILESIREELS